MVIPFVCFKFDSKSHKNVLMEWIQMLCSFYPLPDSIWIELCPANWREAFKSRHPDGEVVGGVSTSVRDKWKISCNSTEWQDSHWDVLRMSESTDISRNNIHYIRKCMCVALCECGFFHVLHHLWSGSIHLCVFLLLLHHFCCWVKETQ